MLSLITESDGSLSPARTATALGVAVYAAAAVVLAVLQVGLTATLAGALVVAAAGAGIAWALWLEPLRGHIAAQVLRARGEAPAAEPVDPSIDPLTRTLNRRGVTIALLELMALADRYNHRLSVAMVAIDRLEQVNTEHGQDTGDRMLVAVAETLADTLRMPDRVGRYSGNEFLLVLPETALDDACRLAERLRGEAEHISVAAGEEKVISTLSIGVTEFRRGEDLELFVSRAEGAIVEARGKGYNTVVCADAA